MNPKYLWLVDALQLLTLFVVGPIIGIVVAYEASRGKPQNFNPRQYGIVCVGSGVTAFLLLVLAQRMNADVRTPQYLLQVVCVLLGGLLLGVAMGCFVPVLLRVWRWHRATRLADHSQAER